MRRRLVDALIAEQGHLCAYCNIRIDERPGGHHIEHLLPRRLIASKTPLTEEEQASIERSGIPCDRLDIDHRNLLACCPNKDGKHGASGCGDHKGPRLLPLTPLEPRCETALRYLPTGAIESDEDDGARTIQVLKLDRPDLVRARRDALEGWLEVMMDVEQALPLDEQARHLQRLLVVEPLPQFVIAASQLVQRYLPTDGVP